MSKDTVSMATVIEVAKDTTNALYDIKKLLNGNLGTKNKVIIASVKVELAIVSFERKMGVND